MPKDQLLSQYDYALPLERIAQSPPADREQSKLLVLHRDTGQMEHRRFYDLPEYLRPDDLLVINDTRVTAMRLHGRKPTGAKVEALLLRDLGGNRWDAVVKPGRRVQIGATLTFGEGELPAVVIGRTDAGGRILDFGEGAEIAERIRAHGEIPLPPYVHEALEDASRYQTVYASKPGSAAAPTAGFHFTQELLDRLRAMGIRTARVTLNVGLATFRPVRTENIADHVMHTETISVGQDAADAVNSAKGRVIAVGTTTVRALETAATGKREIAPIETDTSLFITPGYEFKIVDGLITNYHMPKSTLIILVSAFAGRDLVMRAYEEAKREEYRFLSFGDAMLIV